jgi:hypothetical protein
VGFGIGRLESKNMNIAIGTLGFDLFSCVCGI